MSKIVRRGVAQAGIRWGHGETITDLIDRYYILKRLSSRPLDYFTVTHSEAMMLAKEISNNPFGTYVAMVNNPPKGRGRCMFMGTGIRVRPMYAKGVLPLYE